MSDSIPLHKSDCALLLGGYQCTCGLHQRDSKTLPAEQPKPEAFQVAKQLTLRAIEELTEDNVRLRLENGRLREALEKSLTDEQIQQIAASIDRSMPLGSAKILFARRIEAALRREET